MEDTPIADSVEKDMRKCVLCDRVWALFGLALAAGFLYISLDLLTGGSITRALAGRKADDDN